MSRLEWYGERLLIVGPSVLPHGNCVHGGSLDRPCGPCARGWKRRSPQGKRSSQMETSADDRR